MKVILQSTRSSVFTNSFWGIATSLFYNLLVSLFFIILARKYSTTEFAYYLIANTLYQLIASFSSFGLGHWFIREVVRVTDKKDLVNRFMKVQLYFGFVFYVVNILIAYLIYDNPIIHLLAITFGINIVFDGLIYSVKSVNIAELEQKKTFIIFSIDAFLRLVIACCLFVFSFSILWLSVCLILMRLITLKFFLKVGLSDMVSLKSIFCYKVSFSDIKCFFRSNWYFVVIGSVSMVYWRSATIIIAKTLSLVDVANYEISYKIFSIAQLIPIAFTTSIFPILVKMSTEGGEGEKVLKNVYKKVFTYYFLFGILSYTFIVSFSDVIIPFLFGVSYDQTSLYTKEMFLTILVFPTALLQANILVALKLEKFDMVFNLASLTINLIFCIAGLLFYKSLTVINISIFISFIIFHLLQDVLLITKKVISGNHVLRFYFWTLISLLLYYILTHFLSSGFLSFIVFWIIIMIGFLSNSKNNYSFKEVFNKKIKAY